MASNILLMPNFPGWAFDHIAQGVKKYGSLHYDIKYEKDYRAYRGKDLPKDILDFEAYDAIVLFAPWMEWSNLPLEKTVCIFHEAFEMDGYNTGKYKQAWVASDISLNYIKNKQNVLKVQAGIDLDHFYPEPVNRRRDIVGWVGAYSGHVEKKGYEKFYQPLKQWYILNPHTKEEHYVEGEDYHKVMREYFKEIDVLVCTSSWEGYPLVVLEASACGVPVVSTKVGIVPEVISPYQIVERDVMAFKQAIDESELAVADVTAFDWKLKIKEWENALAII